MIPLGKFGQPRTSPDPPSAALTKGLPLRPPVTGRPSACPSLGTSSTLFYRRATPEMPALALASAQRCAPPASLASTLAAPSHLLLLDCPTLSSTTLAFHYSAPGTTISSSPPRPSPPLGTLSLVPRGAVALLPSRKCLIFWIGSLAPCGTLLHPSPPPTMRIP